MSDLDGTILAGYEILAKIGQGGMGAVYKARQPMLNRLVALKIVDPHLAEDPEYVARFQHEAAAAAKFNHPNLVAVYAAGQSEGMHYMAMELVEGETLQNRIDRHPIDIREALAVAVYVARALKYAWDTGRIIHRDIKPENIFLSDHGNLKLGDLGLAKRVGSESATLTTTNFGTPYYCSPEQIRGDKHIDFHADMYGLGCTLYYMLSGCRPYQVEEEEPPTVVVARQLHDPPPTILKVFPACPMPLVFLLKKMLAKHPTGRHHSYDELLAELGRIRDQVKHLTLSPKGPPAPGAPPMGAPAAARPHHAPAPTPAPAGVQRHAPAPAPLGGYIVAGVVAFVLLMGLLIWSPWKKRHTDADSAAGAGSSQMHRDLPAPAPPVSAETQLRRVLDELNALNRGAAGATKHRIDGGKVVELTLTAKDLANPAPLRALTDLRKLGLAGTKVADLSALHGLRLEELSVTGCPVRDLEPLKGMPLRVLHCDSTHIANLAPLAGMPLEELSFRGSFVSDLSPLKGMSLRQLNCAKSDISDLKPLAGLPLKELHCDFKAERDAEILRSILTLERINDMPATGFWKKTDDELAAARPGTRPAAGAPADDAAWKGAVNLLPLIDPQKDSLKGTWTLENGALVSDDAPLTAIEIPYQPGEEYDFRIVFTRREGRGRVVQALSKAGRSFGWFLGAQDNTVCAFAPVAGAQPAEGTNPTRAAVAAVLETGRQHTSVVEVRKDGVKAWLDGKLLSHWRTDYQDMGPAVWQGMERKDNQLGLGTGGSAVAFHRIEVRDVAGKGRLTRAATPAGADDFAAQVAALPADKQLAAVLARIKQLNPAFDGRVQHRIEGGKVTEFAISTVGVTDITPVAALKSLTKLALVPWAANQRGTLADLSPLKGLPLTWLLCHSNPIADLSPLRNMPLATLHCGNTAVADLRPLVGMKLTTLNCNDTPVADLWVLEEMPLAVLWCHNTKVTDLIPLTTLPALRELRCDFVPERDAALLKDIKTLKRINEQSDWSFWLRYAKAAAVGALPSSQAGGSAKDQLRKLGEKLLELNPGFTGPIDHEVAHGRIVELSFSSTGMETISPVAAITTLKRLAFAPKQGLSGVSDLAPLKELSLTELDCHSNPVEDLSPLSAMPLMALNCRSARVSDLAPLKDTPLKSLECGSNSSIRDISVLRGKPLETLSFGGTGVTDLSPVAGMRLRVLRLPAGITDISMLRGMPLEELNLNDSNAKSSLSDLAPLQGMPLHTLSVHRTQVSDLTLLQGCRTLRYLDVSRSAVSDLAPLKALDLEKLYLQNTAVRDLTPLKSMPLTHLSIHGTGVSDFSLLRNLPLKELTLDFDAARDTKLLRAIRTLERINDLPAVTFWGRVDAGESPQPR